MCQSRPLDAAAILDREILSNPSPLEPHDSKSQPTRVPPEKTPSDLLANFSWIESESSDDESLSGSVVSVSDQHQQAIENSVNRATYPISKEYVFQTPTPCKANISPRKTRPYTENIDGALSNCTFGTLEPAAPYYYLAQPVRGALSTSPYFREKKWDFFPELGPPLRTEDISDRRIEVSRLPQKRKIFGFFSNILRFSSLHNANHESLKNHMSSTVFRKRNAVGTSSISSGWKNVSSYQASDGSFGFRNI
ncbi:hypothetical protein N7533_001518 [Penicillium manginii]|uniref:uncharacterized protein n=1 Tax=Penicillium manginii TaxID=203109 RepID=UPI0025481183|nr:uncharacterized protein N7533_001518 [Penicillium manginii]KAJ5762837.1 hypothetical protein N7533_001518 [Penicillium manginii]